MLRCCRYLLLLLLLVQVFLSGKQSLAQSRAALFFRATGHHLSDTYAFLSFWEARGGEPILGLPITEPFEQDGAIVQYLERARLEYHPRLGLVLLGRLGAERTRWRTFRQLRRRAPTPEASSLQRPVIPLHRPFGPFGRSTEGWRFSVTLSASLCGNRPAVVSTVCSISSAFAWSITLPIVMRSSGSR